MRRAAPYVATVMVACPPAALTGALRDIVADASVIRNALDCSLPVAAPSSSIAANRAGPQCGSWRWRPSTARD